MNSSTALAYYIVACRLLVSVKGSPYVIADDRIRSLDITPVLGRGYSVATNSFQSTCLVVEEMTTPSYNYDYYFTDLTANTSTETQLGGKISSSFGAFGIRAEVDASYSSSSKTKTQRHIVVATMRVERYYSSLKEEESHLSDDASTILMNEDYIGFFKACGPNYVRSIRRAQEVTAIFNYEAVNIEAAQNFATSIQGGGWGETFDTEIDASAQFKASASSLRIKILGFGLGLNQEGSQALVATSMDQYNEVLKFAFTSMTQDNEGSNHGMIYGMEVVPWVDNTSFQVTAKLHDHIALPMPRQLIPNGVTDIISESKESTTTFCLYDDDTFVFSSDDKKCCKELDDDKMTCKEETSYDVTNQECPDSLQLDKNMKCCKSFQMTYVEETESSTEEDYKDITKRTCIKTPYKCKDTGFQPDAFGKCCRLSDMEVINDDSNDVSLEENRVCNPQRSLDPSIMKNNMALNGEFVALLDSTLRYKLNLLFTLEKCITAVRVIPHRYDFNYLKPGDTVKYNRAIDFSFTVLELKLALDPFGDYSLVKVLGEEIDEFVEMFYSPCLAAILGLNQFNTPESDPQFFKAKPWYEHEQCMKLSCVADNMKWDRQKGGCIPSTLNSAEARIEKTDCEYGSENESASSCSPKFCSKKYDEDKKEENCKVEEEQQQKVMRKYNTCWYGPDPESTSGTGTTATSETDATESTSIELSSSPLYLMDHFCLPQLLGTELTDGTIMKQLMTKANTDCS